MVYHLEDKPLSGAYRLGPFKIIFGQEFPYQGWYDTDRTALVCNNKKNKKKNKKKFRKKNKKKSRKKYKKESRKKIGKVYRRNWKSIIEEKRIKPSHSYLEFPDIS